MNDTCSRDLTWPLTWEHAVIRGEVSANHKGLHCRTVSGQIIRFVRNVGTVLSIVDSDFAKVSMTGSPRLVVWIWPVAAMANAYSGPCALVNYFLTLFDCTYMHVHLRMTTDEGQTSTYWIDTSGRTYWRQSALQLADPASTWR